MGSPLLSSDAVDLPGGSIARDNVDAMAVGAHVQPVTDAATVAVPGDELAGRRIPSSRLPRVQGYSRSHVRDIVLRWAQPLPVVLLAVVYQC
jgi:hypothetical protein